MLKVSSWMLLFITPTCDFGIVSHAKPLLLCVLQSNNLMIGTVHQASEKIAKTQTELGTEIFRFGLVSQLCAKRKGWAMCFLSNSFPNAVSPAHIVF